MNPYLSEKARGEIPRVLKWLRNAGLAFCVFCSFGGLYTLCLSLQDKDYSHIGGYVFWIVVGAVPLALFARGEARRYHARTIARRVESYSGAEVPLRRLWTEHGAAYRIKKRKEIYLSGLRHKPQRSGLFLASYQRK